MRSPDRGDFVLVEDDAISQSVVTVHIWYLHICQEHEVIVPFLNSTNCLEEDESAAILNIVRLQVESQEEGWTVPRQRSQQVKAFAVTSY